MFCVCIVIAVLRAQLDVYVRTSEFERTRLEHVQYKVKAKS